MIKLKRIVSLILVFSAVFALSACNRKDGQDAVDAGGDVQQSGTAEKEKVLFSESVDVTDGLLVAVDFLGIENRVTAIVAYVNDAAKKEIDVTSVSDEVIGSSDGAVSSDGDFMFRAVDCNFDGYCDFMIKSWDAADGNESFYCFVWDVAEENFAFSYQVENPLFDEGNKRVYSTVYDGDDEYVYVYKPSDDGTVVLEKNFCVTDPVSFTQDLDKYEKYMNPADRDGYLILVNKTNLIGSDYEPDDLSDLADTRSDRSARQMRLTAAMALEAMYIEMRAAGYTDVSVTSAYRSYSEQEYLYDLYTEQEMSANGYSREEARRVVDTYSAAPGTSEHQTGLCCDMHNLPGADQAFAKQEVYNWLCENAWKFGFILRFPEDKEDITTYEFEPWHYRFVGRYHAEKIHNLGLCLEEYLELVE